MRWLSFLLIFGCSAGADDDGTDSGVDDCLLLEEAYEFELTRGVPYGEVDSEDPEVLFRHTMDVRIPVGPEGLLPTMVIVHGGGWKAGDSNSNQRLSETFAQFGFATYSINYTLSTEDTASFPDNIQDVLCAIRSLRNLSLWTPCGSGAHCGHGHERRGPPLRSRCPDGVAQWAGQPGPMSRELSGT
jgi:hypothetical protein